MKQITKAQAIKALAKMFNAEERTGEVTIALDRPSFYIKTNGAARFYILANKTSREEVMRKLQTYFEENKFKDGSACKFIGKFSPRIVTVFVIDKLQNL